MKLIYSHISAKRDVLSIGVTVTDQAQWIKFLILRIPYGEIPPEVWAEVGASIEKLRQSEALDCDDALFEV